MSWDELDEQLRRWHAVGDRVALRSAVEFLEPELRRMVPAMVRRTWPADAVEDALRDFLTKVIEVPLPSGIGELGRYLGRAFRNHCIDVHEARRRSLATLEAVASGWEQPNGDTPATAALGAERAAQLREALERLDVADRVILKLVDASELLDAQEIEWLAERAGRGPEAIRAAIAAAADIHDLTLVFDPGDDDPGDPQDRRKRMERFRRRRARARDELRLLLRGAM